MTNQEKFKVLADQIKISNQLETDIILNEGELTQLMFLIRIEHGNFKSHYHVSFHMKITYYLLMQLKKSLKRIATVTIHFSIKDTTNQDEHALKILCPLY